MTAEIILEHYDQGLKGQNAVLAYLFNSLKKSVVNFAVFRGLSKEEGHDCLVEGILVLHEILLHPGKRSTLKEDLELDKGLEQLVFYFCKLKVFKMSKKNQGQPFQIPFEDAPPSALIVESHLPENGNELQRIKDFLGRFGEGCVQIICHRILDNFSYQMIKDRMGLELTIQGIKRRFESCLKKAQNALNNNSSGFGGIAV